MEILARIGIAAMAVAITAMLATWWAVGSMGTEINKEKFLVYWAWSIMGIIIAAVLFTALDYITG